MGQAPLALEGHLLEGGAIEATHQHERAASLLLKGHRQPGRDPAQAGIGLKRCDRRLVPGAQVANGLMETRPAQAVALEVETNQIRVHGRRGDPPSHAIHQQKITEGQLGRLLAPVALEKLHLPPGGLCHLVELDALADQQGLGLLHLLGGQLLRHAHHVVMFLIQKGPQRHELRQHQRGEPHRQQQEQQPPAQGRRASPPRQGGEQEFHGRAWRKGSSDTGGSAALPRISPRCRCTACTASRLRRTGPCGASRWCCCASGK